MRTHRSFRGNGVRWVSAAVMVATWLAVACAWSDASTNAHRVDGNPDSGAELIGTPAPKWSFDRWLRTKPMTLEGLRGKVVLLRWWTEQCHFCRTTLPALEQTRRDHPDLVVVGVFHPKPPRKVSDRHILETAEHVGWNGPIAVDQNWKNLERYWLDANPERNWTSVSFLIDRQGKIRWVHGGGEYHPSKDPAHARCNQQYEDFQQQLETLLAEPKAAN